MGKEINMNQQQQVQINPNDLEDVVCDKCDHQTFDITFLFKRLSAVLSPNGQETLVPLQVYKCSSCGHINEIFLPKPQTNE